MTTQFELPPSVSRTDILQPLNHSIVVLRVLLIVQLVSLLLGVVLGSLTVDVVKALGLKKLVNLQNGEWYALRSSAESLQLM
jgi:hypothetical protein